jgi:hypothetical protein
LFLSLFIVFNSFALDWKIMDGLSGQTIVQTGATSNVPMFLDEHSSGEELLKKYNFQRIEIDKEKLSPGLLKNLNPYMKEGDSGTVIGNGGDVVKCNGSVHFSDYFNANSTNYQFGGTRFEISSFKFSRIEYVIKFLFEHDEDLGNSLLTFWDTFNRILSEGNYRPITYDVKDEASGVIFISSMSKCEVIQAVRRLKMDSKIFYEFNIDLINQLDRQNFSWLIVHEWLWNFYSNSNHIYSANETLHLLSLGHTNMEIAESFVKNLKSNLRK